MPGKNIPGFPLVCSGVGARWTERGEGAAGGSVRAQPAGAPGCAGGAGRNLPVFPGGAGEPEPGREGKTKASLDCFFLSSGADVPAERILQRFIPFCLFFFPFCPFLASRRVPVLVPWAREDGTGTSREGGDCSDFGARSCCGLLRHSLSAITNYLYTQSFLFLSLFDTHFSGHKRC